MKVVYLVEVERVDVGVVEAVVGVHAEGRRATAAPKQPPPPQPHKPPINPPHNAINIPPQREFIQTYLYTVTFIPNWNEESYGVTWFFFIVVLFCTINRYKYNGL